MDTPKATEEIWRNSPLAPDHVFVSNFGRLKTADRLAPSKVAWRSAQLRKGGILSPWLGRNGYYYVAVKMGTTRPKFLVHRLVASAFCEGFDPALSVNHIDGNKHNNLPSNLEWVTLARNTEHQWGTGLIDIRGVRHPSCKLTDDQVRHVLKCLASGASSPSLARAMGVSCALIYKIRRGDRVAWS